jgi:hypothetical protein
MSLTEKSTAAVLSDLARITGRRLSITGDPLSARMQIVKMVAEIREDGYTWAQVGAILGVEASPAVIKKTVRDIARAAQGELARRVMMTPMTHPSPAPACAPTEKEI